MFRKERGGGRNLTFVQVAVSLEGFPEEAELLLKYSSAGGGSILPERRCILLVASVIC